MYAAFLKPFNMSLEIRINRVKTIIKDIKYDHKKARRPKRKRSLKSSLDFFTGILDNLKELKTRRYDTGR